MDVMYYLGKPWVKGRYDCWELVRDVYRRELDIHIPVIPINAENLFAVRREFTSSKVYGLFQKVSEPANFNIAVINNRHCGIWYENRILHNQYGHGVLYEPAERKKIEGYYSYAQNSLLQ